MFCPSSHPVYNEPDEQIMRIALITDIHEDIIRLEKALAMLQSEGYDQMICLGDVTGFSPLYYAHRADAEACVLLLRKYAHVILAGNHDLFTCRRLPSNHSELGIPSDWYALSPAQRKAVSAGRHWLYEDEAESELSPESFRFLQQMQDFHVVEDQFGRYLFSHFLKPDLYGIRRRFPASVFGLRHHFRFMKQQGCNLAFIGHAHPPGPAVSKWMWWSNPVTNSYVLKKNEKIVICPALVSGQNASAGIIFDTAKTEIRTIYF
ncbi:MAG: metallophosphoesterase [Bacteroidales bacterium]|nr:metallophosphoesterase [Bacteroidales bacterium]